MNDLDMDGHVLAAQHVEQARRLLRRSALPLEDELTDHLDQDGWAIVVLPDELNDEQLRRAAAGVLAALGTPFFSIDGGRGLWLDGLSAPERSPDSFGGFAAQTLHIDAPNVTDPPDYTSLLMLRPDPSGGGVSTLADLRTAAAMVSDADRDILQQKLFLEGRADRLYGVGQPMLPFPVFDDHSEARWVRWAGKLLTDDRNRDRWPVLRRFATLLESTTQRLMLERGDLLVVDQRRVAHGREQLGPQAGVPAGARRLLCQAKVRRDVPRPVREFVESAT
jgi:hypothetical protein